jgi:hypothetical protein
MAMMDVGEMRMRVGQHQMYMGMQMGLFTVPFKLVLMLMMRIMDVPMRMDNVIVSVLVFVPLGQVQPDAQSH